MAEILLAVESARSRAPQLNSERLLNFLTERQPPEAKGQAPLFGCAGIAPFGMAGGAPSRGSILFRKQAMFVAGDGLYIVRADGTSFLQGSGIGGTEPVSMANSGNQLAIVNGLHGWTFDFTAGLQQITSPAFSPARTVSFMDGYFMFERRDFNQWFISALFDGQTYSGLDFATAEGGSGLVTAVWQNLQLVFIICTDHIEIWYDAGTPDFPFQRYTGGIIPYGCVSPYSIVKTDGALFFMGADRIYYRLQANVPLRISTHPVETLIAAEPDLAKVECFELTIQGHKLIFMTLPTSQVTLCFDISTGKWHERDSFTAKYISLGRYRARTALAAYNTVLVGDAFDGRIGEIDWDIFSEYDLPMFGEIDTINQHNDRHNIFCSRFELDVEAGGGMANEPGFDPQWMVRKSIDGGMTYGSVQPWRSSGKQGEYTRRLRWLRQGKGRQMMWKLQATGPVKPVAIAGHADIGVGLS